MKNLSSRRLFALFCMGILLAFIASGCAEGLTESRDVDVIPGTGDNTKTDENSGEEQEASGDSCESDADCQTGERCIATVEGGEISLTCGNPNPGGGEPGDSCTDGSQCAQNICFEGQCAAPCADDGSCSGLNASVCDERQVQIGGQSGELKICVEPVVCLSPAVCDDDQTCFVERSGDEVQTYCKGQMGNRSDGNSCSTDSQCMSNYCHEGRFGKYCATPCTESNECPELVSGYAMECAQVQVPHNSGTDRIGLCTRQAPRECSSQEDCGSGERCQFIAKADGSGLEALCIPGTGGNGAGEVCTLHSQCQSGLCLDGSCSAPCVDRSVCGDLQVCSQNLVEKDGATGSFDVCKDIEIRQCTASIDCSPAELLACNIPIIDANGLDAIYCGPKNPGMAGLGDLCQSDADCESGFCWGGSPTRSGECSVFCEEALRDCGGDQVCAIVDPKASLCLSECSREADCRGESVCDVGIDETGGGLHYYCTLPSSQATKTTGEACTSSMDCVTGHCMTVTRYQSNGQACTSSSSCPTEYNECICPLDEPNCAVKRCSSTTQQSACSEVCDPANGNQDCAGGGHDMTVCSADVRFDWQGGSSTISLCTFEN